MARKPLEEKPVAENVLKYGTGFPKSLNIGKAVDKLQGNEREISGYEERFGREGRKANCGFKEEYVGASGTQDQSAMKPIMLPVSEEAKQWEGWGTALKPSHEPICMARKPLEEKTVAENVLKYGTGGINIDESRVESNEDMSNIKAFGSMPENKTDEKGFSRPWMNDKQSILDKQNAAINKMKSLGRFPANLIHDNSEEVRECFPESGGGKFSKSGNRVGGNCEYSVGINGRKDAPDNYGDSGNASRFFKSIIYQAKASKSERNRGCDGLPLKEKVFNGKSDTPSVDMKDVEKRFTTQPKQNNHPTVKPVALMEYLIKMVTPKGGVVLDPFAGSGSTLVAAKQNGYNYIGIEMTEEYIPIIEARLK